MVSFYFATNRNPDDYDNPTDFGQEFSRNGLTDLRFGRAQVTGAKLDRYVLEVAPEKLDVPLEQAQRGDLSGQVLGSTKLFYDMRAEMIEGKRDALLSIHGFDYTFREALQRTAVLAKFYAARPMTIILFTWPSDGSKLPLKAYATDRDDARASGAALGRGMQKLANFLRGTNPQDYCGQSIHILAHSMGNYVLRHAVQAIRANAGSSIRRLFDQVVLMAPDEDDDAFELEHKLAPLPDIARRVTVYCNPGDKALVISDVTKGNPDRLGASGPRNARALPDKVSVVNAEPVVEPRKDPTGHQYYRLNTKVRRDVLQVLDGVESPDVKGRGFLAETKTYRLVARR